MKKVYRLFLIISCWSFAAQAQVSGTKNIPGDYATLAAAITDLNANGVGTGGVTINLVAGNPQTAPAGGYLLGSATLNASTSATKTITFNGNGNTITSQVGTSTSLDAIFCIRGTDYVTINNLNLAESAGNTSATTAMEYGYALVNLNSSAPFDGCQYNTIQNCTVTLNRTISTPSKGIYMAHQVYNSTSALLPTAAADMHNYNKFYGNTLTNCISGVYIAGATSANDEGNDIGGTSAATGNTMTNVIGALYNSVGAITATYQNNCNVSYNIINNTANGGTNSIATSWGIYAYGPSCTYIVNNNTITLVEASISPSYAIYGIYGNAALTNITANNNIINVSEVSGSAVNNIAIFLPNANNTTINNNTVTQTMALNATTYGIYTTSSGINIVNGNTLKQTASVAVSAQFYSIVNGGTSASETVQNNVFDNSSASIAGTGYMALIYVSNQTGNRTITGNRINGTITHNSSADFYGILCNPATAPAAGMATIANNTLSSVNKSGSGGLYGIYYSPSTGTLQNVSINDNTFSGLASTGSGNNVSVYTGYGNTVSIYNNVCSNISGAGSVFGIYSSGGTVTTNIYKNKMYGMATSAPGGFIAGVTIAGGTTSNVYNNLIGNLTAPAATGAADVIRGINLISAQTNSSINIDYNTIYLNASSTGANFHTSGIFHTTSAVATTAALTMRNNLVYNISTPSGSGITSAYRRSSAALNNYTNSSNNNLFYAGTPGASNLLYYDGTNSAQTVAAMQGFVAPRESNSVSQATTFVSTTGSNAGYLHVDPLVSSLCDGGATPIAAITDDYDGDLRDATTPDIGADEFIGCSALITGVTNGSRCGAGSVTLQAAGNVSTTQYKWYDNGGTLLGTTTTGSWSTPSISATTTYYVSASTAACETPARTAVIATINTLPAAPAVTPSSPVSICLGNVQNLTADAVGGYNYSWSVSPATGGGAPGALASTSATPTATGTYVYTVTVTNPVGNCTNTASTAAVTVNPVLTPSVSIASDAPSPLCSGTSVTFTATPTNGGSSPTYSWSNGSATIGSGASISYMPVAGDVISCSMTSNAVCATPTVVASNNLTMTVTTTVTPTVSISSNAPSPLCSGTSVTFTASAANGGSVPVYTWKRGATVIGTGNPFNYTPSNGDVITCELTSNAPCATVSAVTSNNLTMTVTPTVTPTVSISSNAPSSLCAGTSVTFTASAANGGSAPVYTWKQGATVIGTGNPFNYTPSNGDVITCELTSNAPCATVATVASNALTMTVYPVVTPSVSISSNAGSPLCSGTSVTFTATPTNGGSAPSFVWKSGSTVIGTTNPLTYTMAGTETITCELTTSAPCATVNTVTSNALILNVTTTVVPSVFISSSAPAPLCSGTSVTFTATPTNGGASPSYSWKSGTTTIGSGATMNYTPVNGEQITCVLTSSSLCANPSAVTSNVLTMNVTTTVVPSVSMNVSPSSTVCAGTAVTYTALPTNGGVSPAYIWRSGSAIIGTGPTLSYTPVNGETISCEMASNAPCATPSNVINSGVTMTVIPLPVISVSPSGPLQLCTGHTLDLAASGTTGTYHWYNGTTQLSGTAATYTVNSSGVYNATVTANGCTSLSNTVTITEVPAPAASISAAGATRICNGQSVVLQFTGTGSAVWLVGGSNTGTTGATYTASAPGIYSVSTTNGACTVVSNEIEVEVVPVPNAIITLSGPTTFCEGSSVLLSAGGSVGDSYIWRRDGSVAGNGPDYTATVSGNYTYEVISATCSASSAAVRVTVNPLPSPVITVNGNVMSTSTGYSSYQWARNGTDITGANGFTYSAQIGGTYTVSVMDMSGCSNVSPGVWITGVGIPTVSAESVHVYPNPSSRYVYISSPAKVDVRVLSMDGKLVLTEHNAHTLDLGSVAAGVYSIHIMDAEGHLIKVERLLITGK